MSSSSQQALTRHAFTRRSSWLAALKYGLSVCVALAMCSPAVANDDDSRVKDTLTGSFSKQQFVAGERVEVRNATVADDIFAAGKDVRLDTTSAKLIVAAGAELRFTDVNADDLILAAAQMDLSGSVKDDVIAFACPVCPVGGYVRVTKSMEIGDDARLVGREVLADGKVGGHLYAAGKRVVLSGEVRGNAKIEAEHIVLESGARIDGNLRWAGPNAPEVHDGAVVAGQIVEVEPLFPFDKKAPEHAVWWYVLAGIAAVLGILLALILLGVAVQLAMPGLIARAADTISAGFWASLGRGLVLALLGPAVVSLLLASVIGVPIGLVGGAALVLLTALGYVAVSYDIGLYLRRRFGIHNADVGASARIVTTAIGIFVLFIVALLPFIGWAIVLLAVIAGVGAVARDAVTALRGSGVAAAC